MLCYEAKQDLSEYVDAIRQKVELVRKRPWKGPGDFPNLIGISGGRGVGKSTLLASAVSQMSESDLVLDVVKPSDFGAATSLGATVLTGIREDIDELLADATDEYMPTLRSLRETLLDIGLDTVQGDKLAMANIRHAPGAADYGWRLTKAEDSRYSDRRRFSEWLPSYLDFRTKVRGGPTGGQPLLVIPLDDFDMAPALLSSTIEDLGRFLDGERIAVLFAFAEDSLVRAVSAKLIGPFLPEFDKYVRLGLVTPESLSREATDYVTKMLPPALRVELPSWESASAKLMYKPIGSEKTLIDLLKSIQLGDPYPVHSLGDYFEISCFLQLPGASILPSMYCDMLPSNARALYNLYEVLYSFSKRYGQRPISTKDLLSLLRTFVGICATDLPRREQEEYQKRCIFPAGGGIEFDFRDFTIGRTLGRGVLAFKAQKHFMRPVLARSRSFVEDVTADSAKLSDGILLNATSSNIQIDLRRFENVYGVLDGKSEASEEHYETSHGFTRILTFLYEFVEANRSELGVGEYGSLGFPGGAVWSAQRVGVDDIDTDNLFLLLPDFEHHLPVFVYNYAWNHWIDQLRISKPDPRSEAISDIIVLLHFCLLCDIQSGTRHHIEDMPKEETSETELRTLDGVLREDLAQRINNLSGDTRHCFMAEDAFSGWLLTCAFHSTSSLIMSPDLHSWFIEHVIGPLLRAQEETGESGFADLCGKLLKRGTINADSLPAGVVVSDLLHAISVTAPDIFQKHGMSWFEEWGNYVRSTEGGRASLAQQLVDNDVLSVDEGREILAEGVGIAMQAKIAQLPKDVQDLVYSVFSKVGDEGPESSPLQRASESLPFPGEPG